MPRRTQGSGSVQWLNPERTKARLRVFVGARQVTRRVTVSGPREAERLLRELQSESGFGPRGSDTLRSTIAEYISHNAARWSPRTTQEAQRFLDNVLPVELGSMLIDDVSPKHLERFYGQLGHLSPASVRRYHAVIRAALNMKVRWRELPSNPAQFVELRASAKRRVYAPETKDVLRFLEAARARDAEKGMMLTLMAFTGIRRGECCALRWEHVDLDAGELTVGASAYRAGVTRGVKQPKSAQGERTIPLGPSMVRMLSVHVLPSGYVFGIPGRDEPPSPDALSTFTRRVADSLGMRELHVHSLRHWALTELAPHVTPSDLAAIAGHARASFTADVYMTPRADRQREALEALENRTRKSPAT